MKLQTHWTNANTGQMCSLQNIADISIKKYVQYSHAN